LIGAGADLLLDFHADGLQVETELLQNVHGDTLAELNQAEQQVFRSDDELWLKRSASLRAKAKTCCARGVKLFMASSLIY